MADQAEFAELAMEYMPSLYSAALRMTRNPADAEDLVQATCLRALEKSHQFEPGTRLDRWLFSILHSIWLNEIRAARYRQGQGLIDPESALIFDGTKEIETNILARQVLKEVQSLPQAQRETLFLVYVEGFPYRETAQLLDVPIGTVMSRLHRGRKALQKALFEFGVERGLVGDRGD